MLFFPELNRGKGKTYLVACERTRKAMMTGRSFPIWRSSTGCGSSPPRKSTRCWPLGETPLLLDVREPGEYCGELGHICASTLVPLRELADRAAELERYKNKTVVAICRFGVRSTTAAAILAGLGFERVYNLKDGMVEWNDRGLAVERR